MKKFLNLCVLLGLFLSLSSCKNALFNMALEKVGVYDENIRLKKLQKDSSEIVFFPMIHISTKAFYDDVKFKLDSLQQEDVYYVYYEKVKVSENEDTLLRKFRKLNGIPLPKNGYMESIDSLLGTKFKIKLKKEIINQPSYELLGVDSLHSRNVDVDLRFVIDYYEDKYGEITLEPCDFETGIYKNTACTEDKIEKQRIRDAQVESRNEFVLKVLEQETRNKIIIIYGRGHYEGIEAGLLKKGYVVVQ